MRNSSLLGVIQLDQIQQQREGTQYFSLHFYCAAATATKHKYSPLLLCLPWGWANDQTFVHFIISYYNVNSKHTNTTKLDEKLYYF